MSELFHKDNSAKSIEDYFNSKADTYIEKSESASWSFLRKRELRSCMKLMEPREGELILDAGCGAGYYTRVLKKHGARVWAVDISEKMCRQVSPDVAEKVIHDDISRINLGKTFDKILCAGVLEFTVDPCKTIGNLSLHLKKGGRLILLVPKKCLLGHFYYWFHRSHNITVKLFTQKELIGMCGKNGLAFVKCLFPSFSMSLRFDKC
jgi:2-polyprenyl-3-methyl-5-hydroxy-6-metoxy-1,4-benzoquinol methylase